MSISKRTPTTVAIRPSQPPADRLEVDRPAMETIVPGYLIEKHDDATYGLSFGVHDSANEPAAKCVALDQIELNKGLSDNYAAGDLVKAWHMSSGDRFYGVIPSGQNITQGDQLQSNGDGKLKAFSSGPGGFVAVSSPGDVTEDTRLYVEVQ